MSRALRDIVTNAGCRDSNEMRIHEIPVSQRDSTGFVTAGTIPVESYNRSVVEGGVLVFAGGVIVGRLDITMVNHAKVEQVAALARDIWQSDNRGSPASIREGEVAFRLHTQSSASMTCRVP